MKIKTVCVVGMGYVGLTLAVVLAENDYEVYGVEINPKVVKDLKAGKPHFHEINLDKLLKRYVNKNLFITEKMPEKGIDVFIISVGSPIDKETKKPILDSVVNSAKTVAENLNDGSLVILRSTVPVGTTRKIVKPILDKSGKSYHLAFCPERTIEGKALTELKELPQIIGGLDEDSVDKAQDLFRKITPTIIEVDSLESAEMVKLLNNTYRDLMFAYANEVAMICEKLNLDAVEVIKKANLGYSRSNIPTPGFVGGACLEKDPHILVDMSKKEGYIPNLIKTGRDINENQPAYVVEQIVNFLKDKEKEIAKSKILVSGFGFKGRPETDDTRGSLTLDLVKELKKKGFENICGHDFVISGEKLKEFDVVPCKLEEGFSDADCVIIANNHESYLKIDIERLTTAMKEDSLIYDVWHLFYAKEMHKKVTHMGVGF